MSKALKDRMNRQTRSSALINRMKKSMASLKGKKPAYFRDDIEFELNRPKAGTHVLDVLSYKAGSNDPECKEGEETYTFAFLIHRLGPGHKTECICRSMFGKDCPACEYSDELYQAGDEESKKYYHKFRNLYNIVSRDSAEEKAKGVQVLDLPSFYFEEKLMAIARIPALDGEPEQIIDFADPKRGKSVKFEIVAAKSQNDYDQYIGHTFLDRRYKVDRDILKQTYKLDELVKVLSYDEMKALLDGSKISDKDEDSGSNEEKLSVKELLSKLTDIDDINELDEFFDDFDLDDMGLDPVDTNLEFEEEFQRIKNFLNDLIDNKKSEKNKKSTDSSKEIDIEELLSELKEINDSDDLVDFVDDNDLEDLGFDTENEEDEFKDEKKRIRTFLKDLKKSGGKVAKEPEAKTPEELLADLKAIKDEADFKKFIKANDIKFKFNKANKFSKNKSELRKYIKSQEESKPKQLNFGDIDEMNLEELKKLVGQYDRLSNEIDLDDYEDGDEDELREDIKSNWDDIPF